jgi:hypothetical protein
MTLAEKLRWLDETGRTHYDALMSVPEAYRHNPGKRTDYLRGYDDAKAECAHVEMLLREANDEIANANARVRELEATLLDEHSRLAQEEAKPAPVGVVGSVLGYGIADKQALLGPWIDTSRERAQRRLEVSGTFRRVVAIVDPAQIVELASKEPVGWRDDDRNGLHHKREMPAYVNPQTVTPLYPGIAQPAQERGA